MRALLRRTKKDCRKGFHPSCVSSSDPISRIPRKIIEHFTQPKSQNNSSRFIFKVCWTAKIKRSIIRNRWFRIQKITQSKGIRGYKTTNFVLYAPLLFSSFYLMQTNETACSHSCSSVAGFSQSSWAHTKQTKIRSISRSILAWKQYQNRLLWDGRTTPFSPFLRLEYREQE